LSVNKLTRSAFGGFVLVVRSRAKIVHVVQRARDRANRAKPSQMIRKTRIIQHSLAFRDYLRTHDEARERYAQLKHDLVQDPSSHKKHSGIFSGYNCGKDKFIKEILEKSGFDAIHINFCMHDAEWAAYRRMIAPTPADLENPRHFHFCLYKGCTIAACAHLEIIEPQKAHIHALVVDLPFQNQGIERVFTDFLNRWLTFLKAS